MAGGSIGLYKSWILAWALNDLKTLETRMWTLQNCVTASQKNELPKPRDLPS